LLTEQQLHFFYNQPSTNLTFGTASVGVRVYIEANLTRDDFVDGTDFAIVDNNAANFVSAITP